MARTWKSTGSTAGDVEQYLKLIRSGQGLVPKIREVEALLCSPYLPDSEARLLSYLVCVNSIDMTVPEFAALFGWSERKAYYVIGKLEGLGLLRRTANGIAAP